jgi:phosphatidylinositol alpha-1,6-mannosyltransferase
VVVTDEGALPELVAIGDCGRVAAAADPGAFANAILDLLADPAQARRLGERGAQAATQFDAEAIGQRVYALYQRLIDGRGGAG